MHDEPAVFAAELRALAGALRDHGLDAVADPDRAEVRVGVPAGGVVTVDLRPDLYRRYLEDQEEQYAALGGDPRAHAWTAWCRLVAGLLRDGAPGLALVAAPDGEVRLVPGAASDPDLGWSAEPGR